MQNESHETKAPMFPYFQVNYLTIPSIYYKVKNHHHFIWSSDI